MTVNSAHARDIAFLVHQQTDLASYQETGGKFLEAMAGL